MTAWDRLADDEIEVVCGYIKDDASVAAYFGVSPERVAQVRAQMPSAPRWLFRSPKIEGGNSSSGINAHLVAAEDAERGSRILNERIQALFRKWEDQNGFQRGAAQILLPAGYAPRKIAA